MKLFLLALTACGGGSLSTKSSDDLDARITALEEAAAAGDATSNELTGRVAALEAALADQLEANQAAADELAAMDARLVALEAAGSPELAQEVEQLSEDLAALRLELDELAGNVAGLLENGPAVWSLSEDVPTGGQDISAWSSIHSTPLNVDLSGGPVVAYCWVNSNNQSRYPRLRISLTDSSGTTHTSLAVGDELRADGTTHQYITADQQLTVLGTFTGVAAGPAEVSCEAFGGYFWTVELTVVDLGI